MPNETYQDLERVYTKTIKNKTFEQFIKDNGVELTEGTVGWRQGLRGKVLDGADFTLRVKTENPLTFYIHPTGRNGDTLDGTIVENQIIINFVTT